MSLMLSKTIASTGKTSDVRYITLSYEGSHEVRTASLGICVHGKDDQRDQLYAQIICRSGSP